MEVECEIGRGIMKVYYGIVRWDSDLSLTRPARSLSLEEKT